MSADQRADRPRGVDVFPMPDTVAGPFDRYAVLVRVVGDSTIEVRMVHSEGVTYVVTDDKPWTWNDYNPDCPAFTPRQLCALTATVEPVDLADWCHAFGARTASNFAQVHAWAVGK